MQNNAKGYDTHALVSIVIPVYNAEKTLERCIDSVLSQTYRQLEIILVDDGSTDSSGLICDEYVKTDNRIEVIHKENGGLVSARKCGIKAANGNYIQNIDSDDWIEPEMIDYLLNKAIEDDADIVTSGYYRVNNNDSAEVFDLFDEGIYIGDALASLQNEMIFKKHVRDRGISPCIWCKLFKSDIIKEVSGRMPNDIKYAEDGACVYSCMLKAKRVAVTKKAFYHYIMSQASMIHSVDNNFFRNLNAFSVFMRNEADINGSNENIRKQIDVYISECCLIGLNYFLGMQDNSTIPYYYFENSTGIKESSRIILYAAGAVGQSYIKDFFAAKRFEVIAWVDQGYREYIGQGYDVCPVEEITNKQFDYIIIAVKFEGLANKIKEHISNAFGVSYEKLIWESPACILDRYVAL